MRDINVAITGTLNAAAKTVTFNRAIDKNKLLTIVNTTANVEIYTANDETNGGTLNGGNNVLTVDYDTTAMNNSDLIQVIYEGAASTALAQQATLAPMASDLSAINSNTPALGQAAMANSTPVTMASDQTPILVDAANPFPVTGPLTDAQLRATAVDVIVQASALPSGAATETTLAIATTFISAVLAQLQATIAVTQSGTWTVQPGNTANTTAWKVDGSAVTQPVSGTITATPPKATTANTPSILTSGGDVIASNASRKSWGIVNLGTNPLFVRMATGASSSVFHFILAPGVANDDGFGASVSDDIYTGVVSATGTSPRFTVYEL